MRKQRTRMTLNVVRAYLSSLVCIFFLFSPLLLNWSKIFFASSSLTESSLHLYNSLLCLLSFDLYLYFFPLSSQLSYLVSCSFHSLRPLPSPSSVPALVLPRPPPTSLGSGNDPDGTGNAPSMPFFCTLSQLFCRSTVPVFTLCLL